MTWTIIAIVGLLGLGAGAQGKQSPETAGAVESASLSPLPNGAIMYLELSKTVDARKAKAGDQVKATLLADVLFHGRIVLRRDSRLVGHVTEARIHTKENPESRLGIVFDKSVAKGGHETAFSAVILALRPATRLVLDSPRAPSPPGINPASGTGSDMHYPSAERPSSPKLSPDLSRAMDSQARQIAGSSPTDIDGLSLGPAANGQVVISLKRTVKLESGVRMDLRVTDGGGHSKDPAHAP
jgi:hypothetical protein